MARMKAVRRRYDTGQSAPPKVVRYGPIEIDPEKYQRGAIIAARFPLPARSSSYSSFWVKHPGRVFTREQVLDAAWGDGGLVTDRTIDVHAKTLRKKFDGLDFIETVRGVGYRAKEL